MKKYSAYITERFQITKDSTIERKTINHKPQDVNELVTIIKTKLATELNDDGLLDLSDIDISYITSLKNVLNAEATYINPLHTYAKQISKIKIIDITDWDVRNVISINNFISHIPNLKKIVSGPLHFDNLDNAFMGFSNNPKLSDFQTSNLYIKNARTLEDLFAVTALKTIDISNIGFGKVRDIAGMFYCCDKLEKVTGFANKMAPEMRSMEECFYNCGSLKNTDIGKLQIGAKVTKISEMFYWCTELTKLDLSDWEFPSLTTANRVFYNCTKLTSIGNVKRWDMNMVTDMNAMFFNCKSMQEIDGIDNWEISDKANTEHLFYYMHPKFKDPSWATWAT